MRSAGRLARDACSLLRPYWRSDERGRALALLGVIVVLNVALVAITVGLTYWQRAFYNALEARDWDAFVALLFWWRRTPADGFVPSFALLGAIFVPVTAFALYVQQALQIRWRRWMTDGFLARWLDDRTYYRLALADPGTDNPDQRIAEDIRLFVDGALTLAIGLLKALLSLLSFVVLLWSLSEPIAVFGMTVPGYLVWAALAYALLGTWVTHRIGQRLIPLNVAEQRVEADLRFGLMRLRENAEGIAFHGGEVDEKRELDRRFAAIVGNWRSIMSVTRDLTLFTSGFGQVALVFPFAVVAPAYFAGRTTLGGVFQISNAFVQVQGAMSWVVANYPLLTAWCATVERLAGFDRAMRSAHAADPGPTMAVGPFDALRLDRLRLDLPDGRALLTADDVRIARHERVLVDGPSGAGKSTLLRALVGLWPHGSGSIERPAARTLFMPQVPYLPRGRLKRAACFPQSDDLFDDATVRAALADVGLAHLGDRLDEDDAWDRRLSGGEQQALAVARALLFKPDWLYLDEATAHLDAASEARCFEALRARLPDTTIVSIAHRDSAVRFHDRTLRIECGTLVDARA